MTDPTTALREALTKALDGFDPEICLIGNHTVAEFRAALLAEGPRPPRDTAAKYDADRAVGALRELARDARALIAEDEGAGDYSVPDELSLKMANAIDALASLAPSEDRVTEQDVARALDEYNGWKMGQRSFGTELRDSGAPVRQRDVMRHVLEDFRDAIDAARRSSEGTK